MSSLPFEPKFEGAIEGYVVNFLKRNLWKVSKTMEYEDVMQEAVIVFLLCKERYVEVDTPQWFMSLFKTAWFNQFQDLANSSSNTRNSLVESDLYVDGVDDTSIEGLLSQAIGETNHQGELNLLIKQAPSEIRSVLSLFLNAPTELMDSMIESWKAKGKIQVLGNKMICQMLGRDAGTDVLKEVHDYFVKQ